MLHERGVIKTKVFYTWGEAVLENKFDPGFNKEIQWDVPLLDGYDYQFVKNHSSDPGSHHFFGIKNSTLINDIENWGADAVLIFGWNFISHYKCMRYFKNKIPVYFRGDSTNLQRSYSFFKKYIRSLFLKYIYKHIDKAFYVGHHNKVYFQSVGLKDNQLVYAPHAIDNVRFMETNSMNFRIVYNIPSDSILFLYAGKFEKVKSLHTLIGAFSEIKNDSAYLLLIGNGPEENNLKNFINDLPSVIKNRIRVGDFVNQKEMPGLYQSADVFILPSNSETWGLSVNEAMASGMSVIVSDACGCAVDLVEVGVNGYIFKHSDPQSLLEKMKYFSEKKIAKSMGLLSYDKIKTWNFESIVNALETTI